MPQHHIITAPNRPARRAFTLVELMVVIMIIVILSSLTLAGLAGVRQRAREDKTKSTIRKIDAIIRPMYDSYRTRRVQVPAGFAPPIAAMEKLVRLRRLMVFEMPDSWSDVPTPADFANTDPNSIFGAQPGLRTAAVRSYTFIKETASPSDMYGSAECLHMILSTGGFEPDALEFFRPDEIGDLDKDGAPEFWDGWGRPIAFFRWAPGFSEPYSLVQKADPANAHDPLDPWNLDPTGFALIPLIFSAGPDESTNDPLSTAASGYGLARLANGWSGEDLSSLCDPNGPTAFVGGPDVANPTAFQDNITNHDLSSQ
jgi:prepilin-type N-terminal cleavage/methylation domain-containing protein